MNNTNESIDAFLQRNRISQETWRKANIEWDLLQEIRADHENQLDHLKEAAELFAKVVQKFDKVHSVRWRVKNTEHLLEKIVRKRSEENEKYADISVKNYFERVTDLVGIRALHLFKEECFEIDQDLRSLWEPIETPIAYIRVGDRDALQEQFQRYGFEIKNHPAGYRSVHYVLTSQPINRKVVAEIQVRTIFEEGWSEIDHKIRYPNFSSNEQVEYFLGILNRMAGSADEMGGFVKGLTLTLNEFENRILIAQKEKEESVRAMEEALNQLEDANQQGYESQISISKLKSEVAKLKSEANMELLQPASVNTDRISSATDLARNLAAAGISSATLNALKNTGLIELGISSAALNALRNTGLIGSGISSAASNSLQNSGLFHSSAASLHAHDLENENKIKKHQ